MVFTFRLDFFHLKKEASNKPVEAISVKLLNVAVSALFVSVADSRSEELPEAIILGRNPLRMRECSKIHTGSSTTYTTK